MDEPLPSSGDVCLVLDLCLSRPSSTDDDLMGFPSILESKLRLLTEGNRTER